MDPTAYRQFLELERDHWWFRSRRRLYFDLLEQAVQRRLLSRDGRGGGLRILDIGCGMGGMMGELRRFGEPFGVEIEPHAVAVCRQRGFARTLVGSGYQLPHPGGSFDLLTLFDTIEHIEDEDLVLGESRRVLAPGGLLMITVPAYQFLYANNDRVAHHMRRYTRSALRARARAAGLEVVKATYVNTFLFPLILPAVLLIKLKEKILRQRDDATTNLTYALPRWLNATLEAVFSSERFPLRRISFPAGHSLALIARAPRP